VSLAVTIVIPKILLNLVIADPEKSKGYMAGGMKLKGSAGKKNIQSQSYAR
jgi:hypothetical protein